MFKLNVVTRGVFCSNDLKEAYNTRESNYLFND